MDNFSHAKFPPKSTLDISVGVVLYAQQKCFKNTAKHMRLAQISLFKAREKDMISDFS